MIDSLCQFNKDCFFFKEKCFEREWSQTSALLLAFYYFCLFFLAMSPGMRDPRYSIRD